MTIPDRCPKRCDGFYTGLFYICPCPHQKPTCFHVTSCTTHEDVMLKNKNIIGCRITFYRSFLSNNMCLHKHEHDYIAVLLLYIQDVDNGSLIVSEMFTLNLMIPGKKFQSLFIEKRISHYKKKLSPVAASLKGPKPIQFVHCRHSGWLPWRHERSRSKSLVNAAWRTGSSLSSR